MNFSRTDSSVLGRWWWTVDRWLLGALATLMLSGLVLVMAGSPPVAQRINLSDDFHFVWRHLIFLIPTIGVMLTVSLMGPRTIRMLAALVFFMALIMTMLTLIIGVEIKGAQRWLHLGPFSIQPSEFLKPSLAILTAWALARGRIVPGFPGRWIAVGLLGATLCCLALQPDFGMSVVIAGVWLAQLFLSGLSLLLTGGLAVLGVCGAVAAYIFLPHVQARVNKFLDPASGDSYQIDKSLEAFQNGGIIGTGPGEGTVKYHLPDAHADFIFAVAGEEFGLVFCLFLLLLFIFILLKGFIRLLNDTNLFAIVAGGGLLIGFGFQTLINMASSLHMIPTKGMTLPFLSYGGSSMLAIGLGMGMVLALTRKRKETL